MKTNFYIICVGQSSEEAHNILPSKGYDGYLSQEGKIRVKDMAETLEDLQMERLYCGISNRSKQTAMLISMRCDTPIYPTSALRNVDYGIAGGHSLSYLKQNYPKEMELWLNPQVQHLDNCFEEGESGWDVLERIFPLLDDIFNYQKDKVLSENWRIGIVTHAGVIKTLVSALGVENLPIKHCDVIHIVRDEGGYSFVEKLS